MKFLCVIFLLSASLVRAQGPAATTAAEAPNRDTSYIDENGTAHVTLSRLVIPTKRDGGTCGAPWPAPIATYYILVRRIMREGMK
jgi:hypothetical protein